MTDTTALWRRLDTPGHDVCLLQARGGGWALEGMAVFRHEEGGAPVQLAYELLCDGGWRTLSGRVQGWVAGARVDVSVTRSEAGQWLLNDRPVPGLDGCTDLDFGFTPATNLPQLRRLALDIGAGADCPVAWLDVPPAQLVRLPQRYERRTDTAYWYESPSVGYAATLELAPAGFVRLYPGLWEQEG